jgi:flagellar biosynthesis/type III secretory pathway M-ring protein FliF/YscJ
MSPALQILYEQLGSSWANLPRQAKILLPIVGVLVLAAFVGLIMFSGTEENKLNQADKCGQNQDTDNRKKDLSLSWKVSPGTS